MLFEKCVFKDWTLFEVVWTCVFAIVVVLAGVIYHDRWIDMISGLAGMFNVLLCAKGKISNYYFGIVSVLTYAFIALGAHYYASFILFLFFYFPLQFIGFYTWSKNQHKSNSVVLVEMMSWFEMMIWTIISIISIALYAIILKHIKDPMPITDSASMVISIVASIFMMKRYVEQWYLWIIVNILSILLWVHVFFSQGESHVSQLVMWIAFLFNSMYGTIYWLKQFKVQKRK